jgi:hypothetical protein
MNWILSDSGQQVVCKSEGQPSALKDFPGCPNALPGFVSAELALSKAQTNQILQLAGIQ